MAYLCTSGVQCYNALILTNISKVEHIIAKRGERKTKTQEAGAIIQLSVCPAQTKLWV